MNCTPRKANALREQGEWQNKNKLSSFIVADSRLTSKVRQKGGGDDC